MRISMVSTVPIKNEILSQSGVRLNPSNPARFTPDDIIYVLYASYTDAFKINSARFMHLFYTDI